MWVDERLLMMTLLVAMASGSSHYIHQRPNDRQAEQEWIPSQERINKRQMPNMMDPFGLFQQASQSWSSHVETVKQHVSDGLQKFTDGLHEASKLLNGDMAEGVANLVSDSFGSDNKGDTDGEYGVQPRQSSFFRGFFRLLGLDSSKLGVIALNALIFIAELITTSLVNNNKPGLNSRYDETPRGSPLSWILNNPTDMLTDLITRARDRSLPDRVIEVIQSKLGDGSSCIQLLVCKSSPIVWGMQRSFIPLFVREAPTKEEKEQWGWLTPVQRMYAYMPSVREYSEYGAKCESRFPSCKLLKLG